MGTQLPINVAAVGYTNAWPLLTRLDRIAYRVMEGHPAQVAQWVSSGEADVGLMPVGALLSEGDWKVVPGTCIGCEGAVHSVLLVSETPIDEWTEVLLDGVSRTSVVLAQLILRRSHLARDVTFTAVEPGAAVERAGGTTAALVIGDAARALPDRMTTRVDLGQAWWDWTGLPFVFAVWAGRPDLDHDAIAGLRRAAIEGLGLREALPEPDRTYCLEQIRYELDDRALMGLRRFAAIGCEEGLLTRHEIELYGPPARMLARPDLDDVLSRASTGVALSDGDRDRLVDAPLTDLLAAADLRRSMLSSDTERTYFAGDETLDGAVLVLDPDQTDDDRLATLTSLSGPWIEVRSAAPIHMPGATAADHLKWTALARLLTDIPHVLAGSPDDLGIAQAALHGGADDLGFVTDVTWAERNLRQAGFTPVPRDAAFNAAGSAQTKAAWSPDRPRA